MECLCHASGTHSHSTHAFGLWHVSTECVVLVGFFWLIVVPCRYSFDKLAVICVHAPVDLMSYILYMLHVSPLTLLNAAGL